MRENGLNVDVGTVALCPQFDQNVATRSKPASVSVGIEGIQETFLHRRVKFDGRAGFAATDEEASMRCDNVSRRH
jgi:hypothetical protein